MKSLRLASNVAVALLAAAAVAPLAQAKPGDLYVGNAGGQNVVRIKHKNGHQSVVASGHNLDRPDSGAFDRKGRLVIADYGITNEIFRINVKSGGVRSLASGLPLVGPTDTAIGPGGQIYAADPTAGTGNHGAIYKIAAGTTSLVSDGGHFSGGPLGLAVLPSGKILTSDQNAGPGGSGALLEVNPKNGHQSIVSSGHKLVDPYGMTLKNSKIAYVADSTNRSIVRIKLRSGAQRVVAKGKPLNDPTDVAMGLDGKLYAVDDSANSKIIRVDPKSGATKVFASGGKLNAAEGITVQPRH